MLSDKCQPTPIIKQKLADLFANGNTPKRKDIAEVLKPHIEKSDGCKPLSDCDTIMRRVVDKYVQIYWLQETRQKTAKSHLESFFRLQTRGQLEGYTYNQLTPDFIDINVLNERQKQLDESHRKEDELLTQERIGLINNAVKELAELKSKLQSQGLDISVMTDSWYKEVGIVDRVTGKEYTCD